ncbi:hypothetical protein K438DRAFT_1778887 [Mycena galopus ATCC 62051]|nr:hypothetical protein K438DRAFT_1778887 [Mycena galopus ATCC 62051]
MPRQPTVTEIRLANITACLTPALTLLNELNDAFGPPFIQPISNTVLSLISMVQNVKRNKNECADLMETIHQVLYAIVNLYMRSDTTGSLPLSVVDHIGKFLETLHKIYTFIEAQQEGNKIKNIFRQSEVNTLLKECQAGVNQAFGIFKIETGLSVLSNVEEMKKTADTMHKELLQLISTLSDATISERSSSMFQEGSPRIAILGAGGMGKTSLARAVLHHPDTSAKFEHRFFVSAESATNSIELAALIGLHVGLNPGKDLTKPVVQYFSRKPQCLVILDNLETPWEPTESRGVAHEISEITMRGAERPGKVAWTHPCLPPLQPLSDNAAQQTFVDITDNFYEGEDITQLLRLTDNMPLAVDLIAHLVDYEGFSHVLSQWETEKTTLLSMGYDQKSNLDISIQLSLSSPRVTSESKELLSLLSILPDGLSDVELVQSNIPIPNILACKATLLATSLAYQDGKQRFRSLMPIKEHISHFSPPSRFLTQSLRKHFYSILELYQKYKGEQLSSVVNQIASNLGNLQEVLQLGLSTDDPNLVDTMYCALSLNSFYRMTGRGHTPLMDTIPMYFPQPTDHQLEANFFIEVIFSLISTAIVNPEIAISRVLSHFQHFTDPVLECRFYRAAGHYFFEIEMNPARSLQFLNKALQLSKLCENSNQECNCLIQLARLKWATGDYHSAKVHASEAQKLSKLSTNLYLKANTCQLQAYCSRSTGNWEDSMTQLRSARESLGLCGLSGGSFDHEITIEQAEIHLVKSEYAEALRLYTQMVATISPDQDADAYAFALLNIAEVDIMIGQPAEDVDNILSKAKEIFSSIEFLSGLNFCDMFWADMEFRVGKTAKFLQTLHSAWGKEHQIVSFCLERLADVNAWQSAGSQSTWPVVYLGYAHKSKDKLALHKALLFLGDVFISKDEDTAQNLWIVALDGFTYMDVHRSRAQCMLRLGDLGKKRGEISTAIELWKSARPLFERSLQTKDVAQIDSRLVADEESHQGALDKLAGLCAPVQLLDQLSVPNETKSGVKEVKQEDEIGTDVGEEIVPIAM